MIKRMLDGIPVRLKAPHDLGWLSAFGRVFCVFDHLISGNLCFGVENPAGRLFIKYAGAQTINCAGDPGAAVMALRGAAERYNLLSHPNLSQKMDAFETENGFGLVFPWFPGFALAPVPLYLRQLRGLPLLYRLRIYDGLAGFIVNASDCDYVAAGVADEHILYDAFSQRVIFSSVDRYLLMPAKTPYAKMPGSPFYVAPEGYSPGETLDETTNVYTMGALAFTFFGDRSTFAQAGWEAPMPLFFEAKNAVHDKKEKRHQSAAGFLTAWREAVLRLPLS